MKLFEYTWSNYTATDREKSKVHRIHAKDLKEAKQKVDKIVPWTRKCVWVKYPSRRHVLSGGSTRFSEPPPTYHYKRCDWYGANLWEVTTE